MKLLGLAREGHAVAKRHNWLHVAVSIHIRGYAEAPAIAVGVPPTDRR
jgi:hypothetical protein